MNALLDAINAVPPLTIGQMLVVMLPLLFGEAALFLLFFGLPRPPGHGRERGPD